MLQVGLMLQEADGHSYSSLLCSDMLTVARESSSALRRQAIKLGARIESCQCYRPTSLFTLNPLSKQVVMTLLTDTCSWERNRGLRACWTHIYFLRYCYEKFPSPYNTGMATCS